MRNTCPNWFLAMMAYSWTIRNITNTFHVPRAIAQHIQDSANTYSDAKTIRDAYKSLTSQIGA